VAADYQQIGPKGGNLVQDCLRDIGCFSDYELDRHVVYTSAREPLQFVNAPCALLLAHMDRRQVDRRTGCDMQDGQVRLIPSRQCDCAGEGAPRAI
jgi:hypothetical protein